MATAKSFLSKRNSFRAKKTLDFSCATSRDTKGLFPPAVPERLADFLCMVTTMTQWCASMHMHTTRYIQRFWQMDQFQVFYILHRKSVLLSLKLHAAAQFRAFLGPFLCFLKLKEEAS